MDKYEVKFRVPFFDAPLVARVEAEDEEDARVKGANKMNESLGFDLYTPDNAVEG